MRITRFKFIQKLNAEGIEYKTIYGDYTYLTVYEKDYNTKENGRYIEIGYWTDENRGELELTMVDRNKNDIDVDFKNANEIIDYIIENLGYNTIKVYPKAKINLFGRDL